MPEPDYDRLEQFFRKAAAKADVNFNEEDWKKLETRLDAADAGKAVVKKTRARLAATVIIGSLLLVSTAIWVSSNRDFISLNHEPSGDITPSEELLKGETPVPQARATLPAIGDEMPTEELDENAEITSIEEAVPHGEAAQLEAGPRRQDEPVVTSRSTPAPGAVRQEFKPAIITDGNLDKNKAKKENNEEHKGQSEELQNIPAPTNYTLTPDEQKVVMSERLVARTPAVVERTDSSGVLERNKQKAVVELPGAEEGQSREAQAMVQEEHASDNKKHVATPRLSLLLSFAPDFSGTSMGLSSAPGKAFGAMLQYQPFARWSISAGAIKNYKRYTGSGEDYKPPKNYWKYYTNGVIPETIDGSCSILEFPVMVHYTVIRNNRSRWNFGTGVSSYFMQSESYYYNFAQPNPGARERWDSRGSSRFFFNMLNFTVGYERQIARGLMLGLEPYAKIPLEEIGWTNIRLFSSGASFTLRYIIVQKRNPHLSNPSRGPD